MHPGSQGRCTWGGAPSWCPQSRAQGDTISGPTLGHPQNIPAQNGTHWGFPLSLRGWGGPCSPSMANPGSPGAHGARLPGAGCSPPPPPRSPSLAAWLLSPADKLYNTSVPLKHGQASIRQGGLWGPNVSHFAAFAGEGDRDRIWGTAWARGSWAAIGTQGQKQRSSEAGKPAGSPACTPACTLCPNLLPASLPVPPCIPACVPARTSCLHPCLCLPPCLHPLAHIPGLHPCPLPASGCGVAAGASEAAASPVICRHKGTETPPPLREQTRAGRCREGGQPPAPVGTQLPRWHRCRWRGEVRGGTVPVPRDGGPRHAPRRRGAKATWAAQGCAACRCVLHTCVRTCALPSAPPVPPWGAAMGCSGLRVPIAAPCWDGPHLSWGSGRKRGSRN